MKRRAKAKKVERGKPTELRLQKILVPVDLTECSSFGLQYGVALAAEFNAKLIVVHVIDVHVSGSWPFDVAQAVSDSHSGSAERQLHDLVQSEISPALLDRELILYGAPAYQIVRTARAHEADLIVITTHCRTGFRHALLGSVAEDVIESAPCPVLALPFHPPVVDSKLSPMTASVDAS